MTRCTTVTLPLLLVSAGLGELYGTPESETVWPAKEWPTAAPEDVGLDAGKLREARGYAVFGSICGVVPAKTGHLKPNGQWNTEEIFCVGRRVKVTLNGTVIVDANLDLIGKKTIDGANHPGL